MDLFTPLISSVLNITRLTWQISVHDRRYSWALIRPQVVSFVAPTRRRALPMVKPVTVIVPGPIALQRLGGRTPQVSPVLVPLLWRVVVVSRQG